MAFTKEELEEMKKADEEIEKEFCITPEEVKASRRRDKEIRFCNLDNAGRYKRKSKDDPERSRKYYQEHKKEKYEYCKRWRAKNRERVNELERIRYWKRKAGGR
jgi:hypothetical protein